MSSQAIVEERIERLKGEVRKMLTGAMDKLSQKLLLIDQIQRLGLAYHFEMEIDEQLEQIYRSYFEFHYSDHNDDQHMVNSSFSLFLGLVQIFNKFKDNEGNFSKSLIADVQGLLSLFEACHLGFHGDDILDDALAFTTALLESIDKGKVSRNLEKQVSHALNQPIHKGLPRVEARHYIQFYQEEPMHDENLDVERKFPFARYRLVEAYFWMSGIYFEPAHEATREILTKVNVILTIMDDLYDGYGTLEELELFTEAIEKWDVNANDGLPEYMQVFYKTVLDFYDEIGDELAKKGQSYRLFYAKEGMKNTVRAYFAEAKWFHQNHVPMMEEYMPIASVTIGCAMVLATLLLGMGDIVTKNEFDWLLFSDPKMVKASNVSEQERGDAASSVECFMKQYRATEEEAKEALRQHVVNAWKDINEGLRCPTDVPSLLSIRILNFSRTFHVIYNDEKDHYSHAGTRFKELVTSLLVNPLPM
ncbi:hypothetical protein BT93_L3806 [Corymbia citriodora subsp. variegata]|uniref:Uncharacterized protein n=1 Tax=Corymbia citriodora subsp. variegata TaxID=360336 RepID=A0A8T0CGL2_CORYI|nr:hypothetical protein BT93_L3806 [Corymbia citriodora subsp. variegata]